MADPRQRGQNPKRAGGDGVPDVFCSDEQDAFPVDVARWRELALSALMHQGVRGGCEMSLFFVDEAVITDLNLEHMGKTGPTDVLSFPMDGLDVVADGQGPGAVSRGPARPHPDPDDAPLMLGDVVLCPAVAHRQHPGHAGTYDDEIALLVVHGILHVLGFDHATPTEASEMRAREREILEAHHWRGPAPSGFRQEHDE